jgi:SET domain-containing protein
LGGFLNHCEEPNCKRIELDNKWYLETIKDINKNEELTLAYTMYNPG